MKPFAKLSTVAAVVTVLSAVVVTLDANAATTRYEAESSPATCDGTVSAKYSGYSGSGFCDSRAAVGAAVQLTVNAPSAGAMTLAVGYANGSGADRPADVSVNGAVVQAGFSFPATGAWNSWATRTLTANLKAGSNTIRLAATGANGLGNIDHLDVTTGDGTPPPPSGNGRRMESLDRGVVAVRPGTNSVLVSWRLLGLDPNGIGFNVYRSTADGAPVKLNSAVLTGGTNYTDTTANLAQANTYHVRPVINGTEQAASGSFTLTANHAVEPAVRVPLRNGGTIQFVWVGDLDGDGEYDYVVDRLESPQRIEAYRSNGQFLWEVNLGPNSTEEAGSARISDGHWDGVTVYDFDSDGRSEVAIKIANGVRFGNGATYNGLPDNTRQAIAILDGMTGAARATAPIPTDYISAGRMNARFAVGYLDGVTPSLVAYMKNRVGTGPFNLIMAAYRFNGSSLTQQWKWLRGDQDAPDGHNTRVIDVDGDGKDEVVEIGFVLNGDGTLKYSLAPRGVQHGDRFHIAKIDPDRPGLQGYGVQQDNPSGLRDYYYDAATGNMIWQHVEAGTADVGRGVAGDIDPRHPGMEVWAFSGVYNAPTNQRVSTAYPWPQMGILWDGDTAMELLVDGKFEKWNAESSTTSRLVTTWHFGAINGPRSQPAFVGDILGDWREEAVYSNGSFDELIIFTTDQPTNTRLYTLAHNPAYRNDMTVKGYMQDHHVDYFIGNGMAQPPRPDITYAGR